MSKTDKLTREALSAFLVAIAATVRELDQVQPEVRTTKNFVDRLDYLLQLHLENEDLLSESDKAAARKLHAMFLRALAAGYTLDQ